MRRDGLGAFYSQCAPRRAAAFGVPGAPDGEGRLTRTPGMDLTIWEASAPRHTPVPACSIHPASLAKGPGLGQGPTAALGSSAACRPPAALPSTAAALRQVSARGSVSSASQLEPGRAVFSHEVARPGLGTIHCESANQQP